MHPLKPILLLVILIAFTTSDTIVPLTTNSQNLATTITTRTTNINDTNSITQKLSIRTQRSPIYAYPGIIVDFIVSPPIQRTQDQIQQLFQYQFSDIKYLPPRIYISLGEQNDQIRVLFDYQNDIPFKPFTVKFKIFDQKRSSLGNAWITLVFDSISGGISNALSMGGRNEDFIR